MPSHAPRPPTVRPSASRLRLGFMPLNDAAPLIVAQECGFFARIGLEVELSREVGWATLRDKVIYGELHAAHALATLVVSTRLGLGCPPTECLTACILNCHGNAITLSEPLWQQGVRDAATLHDAIIRGRHERPLVLGVVFQYSPHYLQLCEWLQSGGINPRRDVRIVVVPPPQVYRNLRAGNIDGYCAGEPWNSLAVREKTGWCAALSRTVAPNHPEKALLVRNDFATRRPEEHLALVAAVTGAAALCDQPSFRPELARLLARKEYLNLPEPVLRAGLVGPFDHGHGQSSPAEDLVRFSRDATNDPQPQKATAITNAFRRHGLLPSNLVVPPDLEREAFRSDLFHEARRRHVDLLKEPVAPGPT